MIQGDTLKAVELLDKGMEYMPVSQLRYTAANTIPHIENYYAAGENEKGDKLLNGYLTNTIEYIEYYIRFEDSQADAISPLLNERIEDLDQAFALAKHADRPEIVNWVSEYYFTLGATEQDLENLIY